MSAEELMRELLGTARVDGRLEFLSLQRARASCGEDLSQYVNDGERVQNERGCYDF